MQGFAIGLMLTYVVLGVLVAVTVRLSHAAFTRLPGWGIVIVYAGIGALCAFMLAVGNVLAIMGALTIAVGLIVLAFIRTLPVVVPHLADALHRPFRRAIMKDPPPPSS